jgi:hypothetical protein
MDKTLFVKLMGMTFSHHDPEALTALRKANAMLLADNMTWEEYLNVKPDNSYLVPPSQRARREPAPWGEDDGSGFTDYDGRHRGPEIDDMFETAFATARGSFVHFLESINEWWKEKGFLTEKQYKALRRAAKR